jgi:DNA-binding NarL/FixJ family response regulator
MSQYLGALSNQEIAIAKLMAEGVAICEMANLLGVPESAVHRHMVNVFNKLGARTRAEMIAVWHRLKEDALRS